MEGGANSINKKLTTLYLATFQAISCRVIQKTLQLNSKLSLKVIQIYAPTCLQQFRRRNGAALQTNTSRITEK